MQYDGRAVVDPVFDYMEHGSPYKPSAWMDKTDIWQSKTNDGSMDKFVNIDPKDFGLKLDDDHNILISAYIQGFTLGTRRLGKQGFNHLTRTSVPANKGLNSLASH